MDEYREAGSYEVEFNAGSLSSGIYFYTLNAGQFSETKQLILTKVIFKSEDPYSSMGLIYLLKEILMKRILIVVIILWGISGYSQEIQNRF